MVYLTLAGFMENGKYLDSERGTPQGNGVSPILANIYLHYVLDNWFDVFYCGMDTKKQFFRCKV